MSRTLLSAAGAFALATVAACSSATNGSGTGGPGSSSTSSSSSAPTSAPSSPPSSVPSSAPSSPPSSAPSSSGAGPALSGLVLQASDLPSGFTASPVDPDATAKATAEQRRLVACVGTGTDTSADRVDRVAADFAQSPQQFSSDVTRWKTQDDVDANVALLNQPRTNACYQKQIRDAIVAQLPAGATVDRVDMRIAPAGPSSGNLVATAQGAIVITVQHQQVTVTVGAAFITGNRLTATVQWVSAGQPVPTATIRRAVQAVADRVAHA